jgi:hypothetical protein
MAHPLARAVDETHSEGTEKRLDASSTAQHIQALHSLQQNEEASPLKPSCTFTDGQGTSADHPLPLRHIASTGTSRVALYQHETEINT